MTFSNICAHMYAIHTHIYTYTMYEYVPIKILPIKRLRFLMAL